MSVGRIWCLTWSLVRSRWLWLLLVLSLGVLSQQANIAWKNRFGNPEEKAAVARGSDILFIATAGAVGILASLGRASASGAFSTGLVLSLQQRLHDTLLRAGPKLFRERSRGDLIQTTLQRPTAVASLAMILLVEPIVSISTVVVGVLGLRSNLVDPAAMVVLGVVVVLIPVATYFLGERIHSVSGRVRHQQGEVANEFSKSLADPIGLMLANAVEARGRALAGALRELRPLQLRTVATVSLGNSLPDAAGLTIQIAVLTIVLLFGKGASGGASMSTALASMLVASQVASAVTSLAMIYPIAKQYAPDISSVFDILEAQPAVPEPQAAARETFAAQPDIRFENVVFSYSQAADPVLDGMSLVIRGGTTTAVVAPSGSGKSTLLRLLGRLYDVRGGAITIGGHDVCALGWSDLRSYHSVARCAQEPTFVAESVAANFRLFVPDLLDADIERACREVGVWDDLVRISPESPLGFVISPRPDEGPLSPGQRRRIELARAIAAKPKILLVDEPTAGLQVEDVPAVLKALRTAAAGRTCVLVSHDLAFVRAAADRVAVIKDRRVVEEGAPEDLLQRASVFRRLWDTTLSQVGTDLSPT